MLKGRAVEAERMFTEALTFPAMLQKLYAEQHTGPVVVHFDQGRPNVIELPCAPVRVVLDKR